jgi:hypothetical protein
MKRWLKSNMFWICALFTVDVCILISTIISVQTAESAQASELLFGLMFFLILMLAILVTWITSRSS